MKKLFLVLLCLFLIVPSALAEQAPRLLTEDDPLFTSLHERSMELAFLFNEALHSEGYLPLFSTADFGKPLRLLRAQDFTQPLSVAAVRADQAVKGPDMASMTGAISKAELSANLEGMLWKNTYHSTASLLTAQEGQMALALSSMLNISDAYICPEEMDGPCFVVMQYGGAYAFLVTFYPTPNATVTAHAQFIPSQAVDKLALPLQ